MKASKDADDDDDDDALMSDMTDSKKAASVSPAPPAAVVHKAQPSPVPASSSSADDLGSDEQPSVTHPAAAALAASGGSDRSDSVSTRPPAAQSSEKTEDELLQDFVAGPAAETVPVKVPARKPGDSDYADDAMLDKMMGGDDEPPHVLRPRRSSAIQVASHPAAATHPAPPKRKSTLAAGIKAALLQTELAFPKDVFPDDDDDESPAASPAVAAAAAAPAAKKHEEAQHEPPAPAASAPTTRHLRAAAPAASHAQAKQPQTNFEDAFLSEMMGDETKEPSQQAAAAKSVPELATAKAVLAEVQHQAPLQRETSVHAASATTRAPSSHGSSSSKPDPLRQVAQLSQAAAPLSSELLNSLGEDSAADVARTAAPPATPATHAAQPSPTTQAPTVKTVSHSPPRPAPKALVQVEAASKASSGSTSPHPSAVKTTGGKADLLAQVAQLAKGSRPLPSDILQAMGADDETDSAEATTARPSHLESAMLSLGSQAVTHTADKKNAASGKAHQEEKEDEQNEESDDRQADEQEGGDDESMEPSFLQKMSRRHLSLPQADPIDDSASSVVAVAHEMETLLGKSGASGRLAHTVRNSSPNQAVTMLTGLSKSLVARRQHARWNCPAGPAAAHAALELRLAEEGEAALHMERDALKKLSAAFRTRQVEARKDRAALAGLFSHVLAPNYAKEVMALPATTNSDIADFAAALKADLAAATRLGRAWASTRFPGSEVENKARAFLRRQAAQKATEATKLHEVLPQARAAAFAAFQKASSQPGCTEAAGLARLHFAIRQALHALGAPAR